MQKQQKIEQIQQMQQQEIRSFDNFQDINLKQELLRGIYAYGYQKPSQIQKKAILPFINQRDLIVQSSSGSGKTATYAIGVLQNVDCQQPYCQALIIVPTRQLAQRVHRMIEQLSTFLNISSRVIIGGTSIKQDRKALLQTVNPIIVGTPGRVNDMISRKILNPQKLKTVVLDQVDQLLSRGFKDQLKNIFSYIPSDIQTCAFSSCISNEQKSTLDLIVKDPVQIIIRREIQLTLYGIKQLYVLAKEDNQKYQIFNLLLKNDFTQCIVFTKNWQNANNLFNSIAQYNLLALMINQNTKQQEKEEIQKSFMRGGTRILILDDKSQESLNKIRHVQVSFLINFDLPEDNNRYLKRVGRSGIYGRRAISIIIAHKNQVQKIQNIKDHFKTSIKECSQNLSSIQF